MFEDDGEFYHLTETVKGVSMSALKNIVVKRELAGYVEMIKRIRSDKPGVPGEELLCPPQRLMSGMWNVNSCWTPKGDGEYVLCHNNDLGQHNVYRLEFGGFWPEWFERNFWERKGPDCALDERKTMWKGVETG